jgi:hypothetical protein
LLSFVKFVEFINDTQPAVFDEYDKLHQNLNNLDVVLKKWAHSLRKSCALQGAKKRIKDRSNSITPDDVQSYKTSAFAQNCEQIMLDHQTENISKGLFTKCRNHLITVISLANAQRSGVISNLTVSEFKNCRTLPTVNGLFVMQVAEHKTSHCYGEANVTLSPHETNLVDGYLHLRNAMLTTSSNQLFVTTSGAQLSQSVIAHSINRSFKCAGVNKKFVSNTAIRKYAVTYVHESAPELKKKLSRLMLHSPQTAEKCYLLEDRRKCAAQVAGFLGSGSDAALAKTHNCSMVPLVLMTLTLIDLFKLMKKMKKIFLTTLIKLMLL